MTRTKETEQSTIGRFFRSRLFLVLAFALLCLIAFSYARAYYQDYAIRQEIKKLEDEVRQLEHKKLESFELLKYVSSDAYVEERGRVEFNLKKPGENVMIITEDEPSLVTTEASTEDTEDTLNNIVKWWYYFTHHKDINS